MCLFTLCALVRASVVSRRASGTDSLIIDSKAVDRQSRLRVFAIVYISINLPLAASYVITATTNVAVPFQLFCVAFALSQLQGLFDSLVLVTGRAGVKKVGLALVSSCCACLPDMSFQLPDVGFQLRRSESKSSLPNNSRCNPNPLTP